MKFDLDAIRADNPLPSLMAATVELKAAGSEWKARCPFHADRSPSLVVFDGGRRWWCFACGFGGDQFDWIRRLHRCDLRTAAALLSSCTLPAALVEPIAARNRSSTVQAARRIWESASPAAGSLAQVYLFARGIRIPMPDAVRFARLKHRETGHEHPVAVFRISDCEGDIQGIQRVYLTDDGTAKLGGVDSPKLSLGSVSCGAVRFAEGADIIAIAEGPETALSYMQMRGVATWAVCGVGNLKRLVLPPYVRRVVIAGDNGVEGQRGAADAVAPLEAQGVEVRGDWPQPYFDDFNDELKGCSDVR